MGEPGTQQIIRMFERISLAINSEKGRLSELDGAIGDADHGITMARGFSAVTKRLSGSNCETLSPSEILRIAASTFLDAVGASTGPLYATAFADAAQAVAGKDRLAVQEQADLIAAFSSGIKRRGKGERGDKTMLDAWIPAAEAALRARARDATAVEMWQDILSAAETGCESTKSMVAARGRALRLGERSLGHIDPGAASAVVIIAAMKDTFADS
jgi:phosphoenolpyruvate---glycerone phosphotransferase subunit DhaL